ncbi:MAG TPA: beta-glucanase, partial [Oceanospirillaceae bacterium]|nr:beta-glucanase [Oceanospirillaceae bacterium]
CYTDRSDNSYLSNGKLIIEAKQESFTGPAEPVDWNTNPGNRTLPYTSARLRTKDKGDWKYGRIEVRAKLPYGQGIWPAIWMMPTDEIYGGWASSGEIDIMEAINLNTNSASHNIHGTIHFGGEWPNNRHAGAHITLQDSNPTTEFHTYTIDWAEDKMRWYVDGIHYGTQIANHWYTDNPIGSSFAPFDQRFHLILNVAVGGQWPGNPNASTQFPQTMEVDYVRVYSCPDSPNTLTSCQ